MPRLTIATAATAAPMGAQVYEDEISRRAPTALDSVHPGWTVRRMVFRSLRSPLPGDRRLPMGWLATASPRARREVGPFRMERMSARPGGIIVVRRSAPTPTHLGT
mgnify:CR=1 FL=1